MATITPQNLDLTAGIAGKSQDTIVRDTDPLLTGDLPAPFTEEVTVVSGQNLAALTVVGFDANGKITAAVRGSVDPADDIQAAGVLVYATDASGGDVAGHIYRAGCFNPDLLVWPASFTTDAQKKVAFHGAPSPSQIVIRKIATLAV